MNLFVLIISSFLIGSIPTGYWLGKLLKGIDIRKFGSGNVGATNAFRVLGKPLGISVLLFDIFKGLVASAILPSIFESNLSQRELPIILSGLAAICGHNWSIFLQFKGGKGVATSLGVLIGLAISIVHLRIVLIFCILIWLMVFGLFGYVSLASIICSTLLPVFVFFFAKSPFLLIFSIIAAVFGIIRHKSNIIKLLSKKENRVNLPWLRR